MISTKRNRFAFVPKNPDSFFLACICPIHPIRLIRAKPLYSRPFSPLHSAFRVPTSAFQSAFSAIFSDFFNPISFPHNNFHRNTYRKFFFANLLQ